MHKIISPLVFLTLLVFSSASSADRLEDILDSKKINIGVSLFTPWVIKTPSGELTGSEIDIGNKLAREMGVKPVFKVYEWDKIITALQSGEIDVIIAGMAITPARALKIEFSIPYEESGVALATNTGKTADIKKLDELNQPEIVIAVVAETFGHSVASALFDQATLRVFTTSDEAEKAILDDRAHAYVASDIETNFLALEHPEKVDLPLNRPLMVSKAGMAVARGEQQLLNFLNAWITARSADEWLSSRQKYWFNSLDWQQELK
jgi:polar amino acid transport system substrate-binding protein